MTDIQVDVKVNWLDYSYVNIEAENSILMELRNYFSFEVDGFKFNPKYKYGAWDGKIRLLDNNGRLPLGLTGFLKRYCENEGLSYSEAEQITSIPFITREDFDAWIGGLDIYAGEDKITPHWYQADAVFEAINGNRRVLNLPTSAGKSLIAALLARWYMENFEGKILVIVPTTALVDQMIDDFADYRIVPRGACLGIRGGTKRDSDAVVYVSTWQTAVKQDSTWFRQFGMLNVDECHLANGASIKRIIETMGHCQFKFGMSGSLKEGKTNVLQYIGSFGDVFRPVTTKKLMEDGQVSNLKINSVFLRYPDHETVINKGLEYQAEIKTITTHTKRNAWVCRLALKLATQRNENVLIMFKNIAHGKLLYEALKRKHGDKVHYVSGETKTENRVELKGNAENEDGLIIVASYGVMSTGISIKKLHHIMFAHPVKSSVVVKQSIGRVLRKHDSKDFATLWDIVDDICVKPKTAKSKKKYTHMNYAYKHAMKRIEIYNDEHFPYSIAEVIL